MCAKGGCSVVKGPVTEENVSDLQVHKIIHPSLIHPCVDIKDLLEIKHCFGCCRIPGDSPALDTTLANEILEHQ